MREVKLTYNAIFLSFLQTHVQQYNFRSFLSGQEPVSPYYVTNILPKSRSRFQKFADSFKSSLQKNSSLTHKTLSQKHSYIDLDAPNSSTFSHSTKESEATPDHEIVDKSTVSDLISENKGTISREHDKQEASPEILDQVILYTKPVCKKPGIKKNYYACFNIKQKASCQVFLYKT